MTYEYSGNLRSLLTAPDPDAWKKVDGIEFTAKELAQWTLLDDEKEREWQHIPATIDERQDALVLHGHFEDVRRIDNVDRENPSFWVALSSRKWKDTRFPIDTHRFPIAEITYRCTTNWARPAWQFQYKGGAHFDSLKPTREWRTVVRRICHMGFPEHIDTLTLRLYATARSTETFEVRSIRFRAETEAEAEASAKHYQRITEHEQPPHYPLLDEFYPMGIWMNAATAKRQAEIIDISAQEYWRLALEDVARHHHNCVILEDSKSLAPNEWNGLLELAENYGIRFVVAHDWLKEDIKNNGPELVKKHIQPYVHSKAVLAWAANDAPPENAFTAHLQARHLIEKADPNHPLVTLLRNPNAFSLFGASFAATGFSHFKCNAAWQMSEQIQTHYPLNRGQQLWITAPTFVYATDTPTWNSCPEMRLMLNAALAVGGRGWFSYTYHNDPIWLDGHCQRSLTGPFLTFSDLWSELGNRIERLSCLTPLFLNAEPEPDPEVDFEITFEEHPQAKCPRDVPVIQWHWLQGPDYAILYVLSNDIGEVTPVYIKVPDRLPPGLAVYDLTDFVRSRMWVPMERHRHLEMFPGQGQIIMVAEPQVCDRWRNVVAARIMDADRRQISIDLELAQRYDLDIEPIEMLMRNIGSGAPVEDLVHILDARDQVVDLLYESPKVCETRSKLIQACAAICGCDGALCRLLGAGKSDQAHEMGVKVLPLTRELTQLRLKLRAGEGHEVLSYSEDLVTRILSLLFEIRALDPHFRVTTHPGGF